MHVLTYSLAVLAEGVSRTIYKADGVEIELHVRPDHNELMADLVFTAKFLLRSGLSDAKLFDSLRSLLSHLFPNQRTTRCMMSNKTLNRLNLHAERMPDYIAAVELDGVMSSEPPKILGFFPTMSAGFRFLDAVQDVDVTDLLP